ncbi:MAG TPA: type II toxin-antitoxin system RelE/ParE family toxin [Thermoanaerobaculia bacterium]|jgi:plasmid stabilization system protein ParE
MRIVVSAAALQQIHEASAWWRRNRLKAPAAIEEELERASALIAFRPSLGARAENVRLPRVRRLHIERIHYDIYYRVAGAPPHIEILAFWGSRRGTPPPI